MMFSNVSKGSVIKALCFLSLLSAQVCHGARIYNVTDDPYTFTLPGRPGGSFTVDVAPHSSVSVTELAIGAGEPLKVTYNLQNSWAQTLFKPFSFLTRWGIGTSLVANEKKSMTIRPHSFAPNRTLSQDFQLFIVQAGDKQIKPVLVDEEHLRKKALVQAVKRLKSRQKSAA